MDCSRDTYVMNATRCAKSFKLFGNALNVEKERWWGTRLINESRGIPIGLWVHPSDERLHWRKLPEFSFANNLLDLLSGNPIPILRLHSTVTEPCLRWEQFLPARFPKLDRFDQEGRAVIWLHRMNSSHSLLERHNVARQLIDISLPQR